MALGQEVTEDVAQAAVSKGLLRQSHWEQQEQTQGFSVH